MNDPRADRRELRRLKRRLRGLRWACRLHNHLNHDYSLDIGEDLKACRYCYTPNWYISDGLSTHLRRWQNAVRVAEDDGAIQTFPEDDKPADGPRLVARFWNQDGREMPALYRDEEGNLVCTWNYLLLVAPDLEAENHQLRDALNWISGDSSEGLRLATQALETTHPTGDGVTGRDMATRARSV